VQFESSHSITITVIVTVTDAMAMVTIVSSSSASGGWAGGRASCRKDLAGNHPPPNEEEALWYDVIHCSRVLPPLAFKTPISKVKGWQHSGAINNMSLPRGGVPARICRLLAQFRSLSLPLLSFNLSSHPIAASTIYHHQ